MPHQVRDSEFKGADCFDGNVAGTTKKGEPGVQGLRSWPSSNKMKFLLASRYQIRWHPPEIVHRLPQGSLYVPCRLILRGRDSVPIQTDSWSCGANSAARFAAMLKNEVANYEAFKDREPTYGGFLWIPTIGANSELLQDYLREQTNLWSYSISQRCSLQFASQHEMNMDNCLAQRLGFVERFNSITTTVCRTFTDTWVSAPNSSLCYAGMFSE
jgi:hypothetical protein